MKLKFYLTELPTTASRLTAEQILRFKRAQSVVQSLLDQASKIDDALSAWSSIFTAAINKHPREAKLIVFLLTEILCDKECQFPAKLSDLKLTLPTLLMNDDPPTEAKQ